MKKLINSVLLVAVVLIVVSSLTLTGFAETATKVLPDTKGYTESNWTYHNSDYCLGYDCLDYRNCNWENYGVGHSDWETEFHGQWHTDYGKNSHCGWAYGTTTPTPYYQNRRSVPYYGRRGRGGGCCH